MPSHHHSVTGSFNPTPDTNNPNNAFVSAVVAGNVGTVTNTALAFNNTNPPDTAFASDAAHISNTGGSQSVNLMQPYIAIYYIIALQGTYPSRS